MFEIENIWLKSNQLLLNQGIFGTDPSDDSVGTQDFKTRRTREAEQKKVDFVLRSIPHSKRTPRLPMHETCLQEEFEIAIYRSKLSRSHCRAPLKVRERRLAAYRFVSGQYAKH
ncbi:hypothetical protein KQX54_009221 [Cotesia glomerata]|uniref:Uncharacterized protein n=1 Tax=Cotesia glomerata TaxID=32391 RepID=A0AAV7ICG0_COTGL|nr:hypothetical protein KQX54_009221 [Cotesia glomerata]